LSQHRAEIQIDRYEAELRSRRAGAVEPATNPGRDAAVFVLFVEHRDRTGIVLMRRPRLRGKHRGEWAFPGGTREPEDGTLLTTAFRETEEELGIPPSAIEHWGSLEPVSTVGTRFRVWPFTGRLDPSAKIVPSAVEVEEIATVPVETFTSISMQRHIRLERGSTVRDMRAYVNEGRVIWGATARILSQIFDQSAGSINAATGNTAEVVGQ
jgi:8-oxo-dGTP pyrophosphatase MutT (NUDIX family)